MVVNSFGKKLAASRAVIKLALTEHSNPVVACSFGKNSMVVLHMLLSVKPGTHVLFNNTLVEYPDTYRFKRKIAQNWSLNLLETKPKESFWWIVDNYGFPLFSRGGFKDASKYCCRYLKEYPIMKVLRKYKFDLYFTGLTRHESRLREFSAKKYGNYFYAKTFQHWKCHPIQEWTNEDVWKYHEKYNIPHNGLYDKKPIDGFDLRTGCWCCTIPIKYGKIGFLRENYPKLWNFLLLKGLGKLMLENKIGKDVTDEIVDHYLKYKPCYFDKY